MRRWCVIASTIVGTACSAAKPQPGRGACDPRETDLTGRFSADRTRFDGDETLVFGPPSARSTVRRRWILHKP
jgi:hypothetical protein